MVGMSPCVYERWVYNGGYASSHGYERLKTIMCRPWAQERAREEE